MWKEQSQFMKYLYLRGLLVHYTSTRTVDAESEWDRGRNGDEKNSWWLMEENIECCILQQYILNERNEERAKKAQLRVPCAGSGLAHNNEHETERQRKKINV